MSVYCILTHTPHSVYCILYTDTSTPHLVLSTALLHTHTHTPHLIWSIAFFNILHAHTHQNLFIALLYTHAHTHTHTQSHSCTPYPFSRKQICSSWTLKQRNTNCILFQLCVHCAISFLKTYFSADMKNEYSFFVFIVNCRWRIDHKIIKANTYIICVHGCEGYCY